jgi:hypothetical protein
MWFGAFIIALTIVNELFNLGLDKLIAWLAVIWVILAMAICFLAPAAFAATFSTFAAITISTLAGQIMLVVASALILGGSYFFYPEETTDVLDAVTDVITEIVTDIGEVVGGALVGVGKGLLSGLGAGGAALLGLAGFFWLASDDKEEKALEPEGGSQTVTQQFTPLLDRIKLIKARNITEEPIT